MDWKTPTEQAGIGFVGYGALSLALSPSILTFSLSSLAGTLVGFGYSYLRPLPWRSYWKSLQPGATKTACVSVTPGLQFREVSTNPPTGIGYIRFYGLDKRDLYGRLKGKAINRSSIPFHVKVALEEGMSVDLEWSDTEPHLRVL